MHLKINRWMRLITAGFALSSAAFAADDTAKINFNLPADTAEKSLRLFSEQSGRSVIFSTDKVHDVRTNPVQGEFTAPDALDQLVAGTSLYVVLDRQTGGFAVARREASPDPNAQGVALEKSDHPAETGNSQENAQVSRENEDIVRMEKYVVSTDLGQYAETNSTIGSKVPMESRLLPSTLQIINAASLADHKTTSINDIYPYIVSLTAATNTSTGFTLRGFLSSAEGAVYSFQVDGLPGITNRFGNIPTANVERIEVLKGPSSVLYGEISPGGIVNTVTKTPQIGNRTEVFTTVSSYAGFTSPFGTDVGVVGTIDTTGPIDQGKHWLYRLIVDGNDLDSFRKNVIRKDFNLFPSLTYRWSESTTFTVKMEYERQEFTQDDGLIAPFFNIANVPSFDTTYSGKNRLDHDYGEALNTAFQHPFGNWQFRLSTRSLFHTDSEDAFDVDSFQSVLPVANSTVVRRYHHQLNGRRFNLADANMYGELGPKQFKHQLLFGVTLGREWQDFYRLSNGPTLPPTSLYFPISADSIPFPPDALNSRNDLKTELNNYDGYVSDQITIGNHWHANVAARYDRQDSHAKQVYGGTYWKKSVHATVPQLGLLYEVDPSISVYTSYSESFNPNDLTTYDINHNNGFPPVKAEQVEVGVKTDFMDHKVNSTLAAYRILKKNVVENTGVKFPNGDAISRQDGLQEVKGLELEIYWLPIPNWQTQIGLSCIPTAKIVETLTPAALDARLPNVSKVSGNLWTRYNIPTGMLSGLGFGFGVIYTGDRVGGPVQSYIKAPSYARIDSALYYKFGHYDIALNVANVLDRHYIKYIGDQISIQPGDPRKVTLSFRAQY